MKPFSLAVPQRGFSLVESAIALLVLGLMATLLLAYWKNTGQQQTAMVERDLLGRAESALVSYVQAQYRLPCPATSDDGLEVCTGSANVGRLPWKTLGIADARARNIRYGLYRNSKTDVWDDADLGVAKDRFRALVATVDSPPTAKLTLLANVNALDFCTALNTATALPVNASLLNTIEVNTSGTDIANSRHNVAFTLALPGLLDADGDGDRFDGHQHTQAATSPVFDAPSRPRSATYDDEVHAMSFTGLFGQLACGQALSAAGHVHINAETSAAIMQQGMIDYQVQMELADLMAGAGVASATATLFSSYAGLANAIAITATATADAIVTYGATTGIIAAAVAAVITNTAATATAIISLAKAAAQKLASEGLVKDSKALTARSETLYLSVKQNARAADAAGL